MWGAVTVCPRSGWGWAGRRLLPVRALGLVTEVGLCPWGDWDASPPPPSSHTLLAAALSGPPGRRRSPSPAGWGGQGLRDPRPPGGPEGAAATVGGGGRSGRYLPGAQQPF